MWTDGRTDRHGEGNSRFSQFSERALVVSGQVEERVSVTKPLTQSLQYIETHTHTSQTVKFAQVS